MYRYRHVLVAVDFSEHGNEVARKAKYLAEMFQARLSAIHVLDNIPMPHAAYGSIIPLEEPSTYELLEAEKSKFKQIADQFIHSLARIGDFVENGFAIFIDNFLITAIEHVAVSKQLSKWFLKVM